MKYLRQLVVMIALVVNHSYTMDNHASQNDAAVNALVKTFMLPDQAHKARKTFTHLLNHAQKQLLISMYWITDDFCIDTIIEAKKRGIDVQLIYDESSLSCKPDTVANFLDENIVPIVYPSDVMGSIMHNKVMIIDGKKVWTGSANFTQKACDPDVEICNYENIVIIDSQKVAQKYTYAFDETKKDIMNTYVTLLTEYEDIPDYLKKISSAWYEHDPRFKAKIVRVAKKIGNFKKQQLQSNLPTHFQHEGQQHRLATDYQKQVLMDNGYTEIEVRDMPYGQAYAAIGHIFSN